MLSMYQDIEVLMIKLRMKLYLVIMHFQQFSVIKTLILIVDVNHV